MCSTDTLPSNAQFPESMSFGRKDTHAQTDANNVEKSRENQTVVADEHKELMRCERTFRLVKHSKEQAPIGEGLRCPLLGEGRSAVST